jgi:hypothetical protein
VLVLVLVQVSPSIPLVMMARRSCVSSGTEYILRTKVCSNHKSMPVVPSGFVYVKVT